MRERYQKGLPKIRTEGFEESAAMMAVMDKRSRAKNHQHSTRSILLSQHATYKFISTQFRLQFNFVVYGLSKTWPRFYFKPIPPRITYYKHRVSYSCSILQILVHRRKVFLCQVRALLNNFCINLFGCFSQRQRGLALPCYITRKTHVL